MKDEIFLEEATVDGNSLFIINANNIFEVLDEDDNEIKYDYSKCTKILTTHGMYNSINVMYE